MKKIILGLMGLVVFIAAGVGMKETGGAVTISTGAGTTTTSGSITISTRTLVQLV